MAEAAGPSSVLATALPTRVLTALVARVIPLSLLLLASATRRRGEGMRVPKLGDKASAQGLLKAALVPTVESCHVADPDPARVSTTPVTRLMLLTL